MSFCLLIDVVSPFSDQLLMILINKDREKCGDFIFKILRTSSIRHVPRSVVRMCLLTLGLCGEML